MPRRPGEQKAPGLPFGEAEIFIDGLAGLFGDLKADRTPGFLLANRCPLHRVAMGCHVLDLQAHHIAAAQLAVDGEIEQCKVTHLTLQLESGADGPDMLGLQWLFWANKLALVPWPAGGGGIYALNGIHSLSPFTLGETSG